MIQQPCYEAQAHKNPVYFLALLTVAVTKRCFRTLYLLEPAACINISTLMSLFLQRLVFPPIKTDIYSIITAKTFNSQQFPYHKLQPTLYFAIADHT